MKKFLQNIKRIVNNIAVNSKKELPVNLLPESQSYVLQSYVTRDTGFTHNEKGLVDIYGVRIEMDWRDKKDKTKRNIFFCGMQRILVHKTLQQGDGGEIPQTLVINDLTIPTDLPQDRYILRNVIFHSNGTMSITSTPTTRWELESEATW